MSNIREKEGDTACYRGEALWLDTEGEVVHPLSLFLLLNFFVVLLFVLLLTSCFAFQGAECRAWVADAHMAREVTRW